VFKGTENYRRPQIIAEATDRLGGSVDAFTGKEATCFYGKVLRGQLPDLIKLLGDLITTPRFEEDELARERKVILEEISQSEDQPEDWANELFYANFWPKGSLAHSILGTREQVANYDSEKARAFFQEIYRAPNVLIAVAGDVKIDDVMKLLQPILPLLPNGVSKITARPNKPKQFLLNTHRKELQQASLVMGFPAYNHQHPDRMAINLLGYILGGGMSSRLFMELREKHALCYQVGSYTNQYCDTGALQIAASCAPNCARELVRRTIATCNKLKRDGLTGDELERAKFQFRTSLVLNQESTNNRMFSLAIQSIYTQQILSLEEQIQEINQVTVEQVHRIAENIILTNAFSISALGTDRNSSISPDDFTDAI
jgi:predicted Zn-dependent peptidase